MATPAASRSVVGLLKRGWNEIPEVIGSSVMALIGLGMGCGGICIYYAKDGDNKRYKEQYTVYRPDDPRAKRIKE